VNWPVAAFGLIGSSYLAGGRPGWAPATHGATSSGPLARFAQQRKVEIAWCDAARGREVDVCLKTIAIRPSPSCSVFRFAAGGRKAPASKRLRSNTLEAVFSTLG
jgi:hypothetical protein